MDSLKKYSVPFLLRDGDSYSNKIAIVSACKYNNGLTCTAGLEWYEKCSGLINKGFTAR